MLRCTADHSTQLRSDGSFFDLTVRDLGRMRYVEALEYQRKLQQEVISLRNESDDRLARKGYLLFVQHDPPVITVSRRPNARRHLLASEAQLRAAGVEVAETDRGGDITYHGPGQLVVYPIFDLNVLNLRIHSYMRFLEEVIIDVLGGYGIRGQHDVCATGVWINQDNAALEDSESRSDTSLSKICAIGVRVSRWVSMHGLALNVDPDLDHFNLIVPCGLAGRSVISMKHILQQDCPNMDTVQQRLAAVFNRHAASRL